MSDSTTGTARTKDGCLLAYEIQPNAEKPRLVLIHSLGLSRAIWRAVASELGGDMEILTYDCRGHGQSDRWVGVYTPQLFADDLAALLDSCGWSSVTLAGCSMGGMVAQAFASACPHRAHGLALIDTTAWYGPTAEQDWSARAMKAAEDGFASMVSFQTRRWFSDRFRETHPQHVEELTRIFLANEIPCYRATCEMLGSADLRETTRALRLPVSVVVGEEDQATPIAMSESLHEMLPGSTLTIIPGGRHLTPVQCPTEIAQLLRNLVSNRTPVGTARNLA